MLEAIMLLAAIALGVIAYQLHGIRHILNESVKVSTIARHQQELDEKIRDACPNLFYQLRPELRDWFGIHERKRKYYEKHKKYGDVISPHSDEESSWFDIYQRLLKSANDDQKRELGAIASATDSFLKAASDKTVLRPAEMNFLAFCEWRDLLGEGGDEIVLRIVADHLKENLASHVEAYRRGATLEEAR